MIKLHFVTGGEIMLIKIVGKVISILGKMSNYTWMDIRDLTESEQGKVSKKHGDTWFKEYTDALDLKENMSEAAIAKDLTEDMQAAGWRLVRKTI